MALSILADHERQCIKLSSMAGRVQTENLEILVDIFPILSMLVRLHFPFELLDCIFLGEMYALCTCFTNLLEWLSN
jgi:hypothetical protein